MIFRVISGWWDWASNLDRPPVRRARYHCGSPTRLWHANLLHLLQYLVLFLWIFSQLQQLHIQTFAPIGSSTSKSIHLGSDVLMNNYWRSLDIHTILFCLIWFTDSVGWPVVSTSIHSHIHWLLLPIVGKCPCVQETSRKMTHVGEWDFYVYSDFNAENGGSYFILKPALLSLIDFYVQRL